MNGDGKLDLICANGDDHNVMVLTNDGHGNFTIACTNGAGPEPLVVVAADVDGDGKPDVLCANSWTDTLTVLLNSPALPVLSLQVTAPTNPLVFAWSAAWPGFGVQHNPDLGTTNWQDVTNAMETVGGVNQLVMPAPAGKSFFRLVHH